MMQGGAAISKDLPPFTIARGYNRICGLNNVGLRRAGFSAEQRLELKRLYHHLFRTDVRFSVALAAAQSIFHSPGARQVLEFATTAKRGLCADQRTARNGPGETVGGEPA